MDPEGVDNWLKLGVYI